MRKIAVVAVCFVLAGCASIPREYQSLVGTWKGDGLDITIKPDGDVLYSRTLGNVTTTTEGPLRSVSDREIVFGFFFFRQRLEIQQVPHAVGYTYEMVLENVKLVSEDAGSSADQNRRKPPVFKPYTGADGGYVAIYTRDREHAVYSVGDGIYVPGLIRVQGRYIGRIFYPTGYDLGDDITQDSAILQLCDKYFPELKGNDWIGGDTGGDYY